MEIRFKTNPRIESYKSLLANQGHEHAESGRALQLHMATHWFERLRGLLGVDSLGVHQGLWIVRCSAVHTMGMRFDLALHFLDAGNNIIRSYARVKPGRVVICGGASSVVEMSAAQDVADLDRQVSSLRSALLSY